LNEPAGVEPPLQKNGTGTLSMTLSHCTLVIMAKAPRVGSVKTRLTENLSPQQATELYECLLNDTVTLARSLQHVETAIMCPESDGDELSQAVGEALLIVPQTGRGLAAGLTSVFRHFASSGRRRVIAFNSDSPHLPAAVLENAFDALERSDLVVGPTHDGGYYLVGAKASYPALFEDDGMGTTSALESLLAGSRRLQLSVTFTDSFYDIDVTSDLDQLAVELENAPARASRTAVWLKKRTNAAAHLRTNAGFL
jgi:rSAM/selenodomain-associated transferase 1